MLSLLLAMFTVSSTAEARTYTVPDDFPLLEDAVANANANGDASNVIVIAPGLHTIFSTINVTKALTIRGESGPPREVDDLDVADDTVLTLAMDVVTYDPGFQGAFVIAPNRALTFEDIRFKLPEVFCKDDRDDDGNGLADNDEPLCKITILDTGAGPVASLAGPYTFDVRAFLVGRGATLRVARSEFQGFSQGSDGNVIFARNAAEVTVEDSRFNNNLGVLEVGENGDFFRSRGGAIHVVGGLQGGGGGVLNLYRNTFWKNTHRFGGAVYATEGANVEASGNAFYQNSAEDGGALLIESSTLNGERNFFVENKSDLRPGERLYVTYEGGALYAEYSDITLRNNVFLANESFDWGASILLRGNLGGIAPLIENNTFVVNNPRLIGGASIMTDATQVIYRNNISYDEENGVIGAQNWALGTVPIVEYNDFFGAGLGYKVFVGDLASLRVNTSVNIAADPLFDYFIDEHRDWRLWRFWLDPLSPAVDSGDPDILDVGGSRSDMGAYGGEFAGTEDADNDGWVNIYDCDDSNPLVQPYAEEVCDDFDNDCNGIVDDNERTFYIDRDFDGYGDANDRFFPPESLCPGQSPTPIPPGDGTWVNQAGDCEPREGLVSPGRSEFCDDIDNDCDGKIDEEEDIPFRRFFIDVDGDGFGAERSGFPTLQARCPPTADYSPFGNDCNDDDSTIHPLITLDTQTHLPLALKPIERSEADRAPGFARNVANGIDEDCNLTDLCYPDFDGDGYGQAPDPFSGQGFVDDNDRNCRNLSALTAANNFDCDDRDPNTNPKGIEVPGDGLDQDCNGSDICYEDLDGDGFGSDRVVEVTSANCDVEGEATASLTGDCDDASARAATINELADEVCDGFDNDCDGTIDEVTSDDAETFFLDADNDGFGTVTVSIRACGEPIGYSLVAGDCNDSSNLTYPNNDEICDGVDNNCVGGVDENTAIDAQLWYQDADKDGYGNPNIVERSCDEPQGGGPWVTGGRELDCADNDALTGPCCGGCSSANGFGGTLPLALSLLLGAGIRRRRED